MPEGQEGYEREARLEARRLVGHVVVVEMLIEIRSVSLRAIWYLVL